MESNADIQDLNQGWGIITIHPGSPTRTTFAKMTSDAFGLELTACVFWPICGKKAEYTLIYCKEFCHFICPLLLWMVGCPSKSDPVGREGFGLYVGGIFENASVCMCFGGGSVECKDKAFFPPNSCDLRSGTTLNPWQIKPGLDRKYPYRLLRLPGWKTVVDWDRERERGKR